MLDWLDKHGELFLRKNTGIGRNLQRAKTLQQSQQNFECVAKVVFFAYDDFSLLEACRVQWFARV